MAPKRLDDMLQMSESEFEELLARAAQEGARRALVDDGLDGREAALDIRDLRALLEGIRLMRRTAHPHADRWPDPDPAGRDRTETEALRRRRLIRHATAPTNLRTHHPRPALPAGFFLSGGSS